MHDAMLAHLTCLNDLILNQQVMHSLEHALQKAPEDVVRYGVRHKVLPLHWVCLGLTPEPIEPCLGCVQAVLKLHIFNRCAMPEQKQS